MAMRPWLLLYLLLAAAPVTACGDLAPARALPPAASGQWLLATQNLWRLRDSHKDARHDSALPEPLVDARLKAQATYIRDRLSAPHLLAVQEVESLALLERLAQQIMAGGGPAYRAYLIEGNDSSGIDVGALVREPVKVAQAQALFAGQRFMGASLFSRPPLLLELEAPLRWSVVVVHLRSGRGLDDPGRRQQVRAKRARQAELLVEWIRGHDRPVLLVGDLNSAPDTGVYSEPLERLLAVPLASAWERLPGTEQFSYRYRCQRQAIDHVLHTPALAEFVEGVAVSRGNAGRYRSLHQSDGVQPVSDHDALGVYIRLPEQHPVDKEREE